MLKFYPIMSAVSLLCAGSAQTINERSSSVQPLNKEKTRTTQRNPEQQRAAYYAAIEKRKQRQRKRLAAAGLEIPNELSDAANL
jgi:hypothetical protein